MYADTNPKTKKLLKAQVADSIVVGTGELIAGAGVRAFSPGPFPCKQNGEEFIEGPHYPKVHTWYAKVLLRDGFIVKVLS